MHSQTLTHIHKYLATYPYPTGILSILQLRNPRLQCYFYLHLAVNGQTIAQLPRDGKRARKLEQLWIESKLQEGYGLPSARIRAIREIFKTRPLTTTYDETWSDRKARLGAHTELAQAELESLEMRHWHPRCGRMHP